MHQKHKLSPTTKIVLIVLFFPLVIVYKVLEIIFVSFKNAFKKNRFISIDDIDKMNGTEFETFTVGLLKQCGYKRITQTPLSRDYGVDIVAHKGVKKVAFQCKCYNKDISLKAVQEVVGGKKYYDCDSAVVITNRGFNKSAQNLAAANKVALWDRNFLVGQLEKINGKR